MKTASELVDAFEFATAARQRARLRHDDDADLQDEVREFLRARSELMAALYKSTAAQAAPADGAVAGPSDDEILNRTGSPYAPGTREYDLDLIRWYRDRIAAAPTPAAHGIKGADHG